MARELKEELLNPRYKVIADFPQWSIFPHRIGDILELRGIHFVGRGQSKSINEKDIDKYPSVLRKLEWWEDRKIEDLSEYLLKISEDIDVVKKGEIITIRDFKWWGFHEDNKTWKLFLPATKEEYEQYQKSHK